MCSQRYSESRTIHEETRRGNDQFNAPFSQRVSVPIERSINSFNNTPNEQRVQERIRNHDTSVQWVNDPISGQEKFRVHINIEGFSQNEVNIRVDGNKLVVYGEHIENHNDSTAKKIIEKSFELPRDVDSHSPHVTFPTTTKMQVDFSSRHSNVLIDDGRTSSKFLSNYDISQRPTPGITQQRSSTEYTSTRRLGGGTTNTYERIPSPPRTSTFDRPFGNSDFGRNTTNTYSSSTNNQSHEYEIPFNRAFTTSTVADSINQPSKPTYTYRVSRNYSPPRTTFPSSTRGDFDNVTEQTFTETHRETHHRRSSPTSGVQSSHEVEHHRSGSPSIAKGLDEDRFRTSLSLGGRNLSPASSRNLEVREFSRRIGSGQSDQKNDRFPSSDTSLFARDFNTEAFYRSAFQPQIYTDDRGQKCIEMKLDVNNYQPNEIKVSVNGNDLIVQAEHNIERPPTSSTRAYFYKQITLPSNTDFSSLASQYHPDGKLHITAKLMQEQSSIRYN
ncbi:unnamed protein product [Adineta ricciae]|uniref:SHSP domain-containing protein n=1 Tax=Adineta ricciae TaxID=249248 RepID=A0A815MMJ5_ADIRI|nr:unnamed protein product [Adineta ricciae]